MQIADSSALYACCWKPVQRDGQRVYLVQASKYTPEGWNHARDAISPSLGGVGVRLMRDVLSMGRSFGLAIEGAVVSRSVSTAIVVARRSGMLGGPLESACVPAAACWPNPPEWRFAVLGLEITAEREKAKKTSVEKIPLLIPNLVPLLRVREDRQDDITDAAGIAVWRSRISFRSWKADQTAKASAKRKRARARKARKQGEPSNTG